MLPIHLCYVDFRSALIHMLCVIAFLKSSVKICNCNALFVTTCGRFVNNVTTFWSHIFKVRSEKGYGFLRPGLKTGVENGIFWSEIGCEFGVVSGTPPPKIPRSTPPPGVKGNTKTPAVDLLRLNTLRCSKMTFIFKRYDESPLPWVFTLLALGFAIRLQLAQGYPSIITPNLALQPYKPILIFRNLLTLLQKRNILLTWSDLTSFTSWERCPKTSNSFTPISRIFSQLKVNLTTSECKDSYKEKKKHNQSLILLVLPKNN